MCKVSHMNKNSESKLLEKLYKILPWPEDPSTKEGYNRFVESVNVFKKVVRHEWFNELVKGRSKINIIDVCGGTGIGGVALGKVLRDDLGLNIKLTIIDMRESALSKAKEFTKKVLGIEAEIIIHDVRKKLNLGGSFDVALLWGYTTPHFNPWDMMRVLANIASLLRSNGLYIYDETDRVYSIFTVMGYKEVIVEKANSNKLVLTVHKGREFKTGYMVRAVIDLLNREYVEMKVYFWDLASSAAFTWIFFDDVDFIPLERPYRGVILAKQPRRIISIDELLKSKPKMLAELK